MIYTCTLNPSIDYFAELEAIKMGQTNRMTRATKLPGGKGINVSRVLKMLGIDNIALGFVGGFSGEYIRNALKEEDIRTKFTSVSEDTRINIKLRTDCETEVNAPGPHISEDELTQLITSFNQLKEGDTLVLAGSVQRSIPKDFYQQVTKHLSEKNVQIVVDTTGQVLMDVLPFEPFLLKPNHHELADLFNTTINTIDEALPYGKKLVEQGARNVIVSFGEKGTLLFTKENIWYANIPEGSLMNSVGAGDSVVAGFLAHYSVSHNIKESFRYAAAAGSATAYSEGFCTKDSIRKLLPQIKIQNVNEEG